MFDKKYPHWITSNEDIFLRLVLFNINQISVHSFLDSYLFHHLQLQHEFVLDVAGLHVG